MGRHRYAVAGVILAALPALAACSGDKAKPVTLGPVTRATVTEVVEAPATVAAKASASVSAPAAATVGDLRVRDGSRVRQGQVLMVLESPQAQQRLRAARSADARAADSRVSLPQADLSGSQAQSDAAADEGFRAARAAAAKLPQPQRTEVLAQIAAACDRYDAARTQAAAAVRSFNSGISGLSRALSSLSSASRVQTQAAVAVAEQTVKALVVRAPIAGIVSLGGGSAAGGGGGAAGALASLPPEVQQQAQAALGGSAGGGASGDTVDTGVPVAGGATLATVTDISTLSLTADVDETDVLQVRRGVPARVELDAVPGATYRAAVSDVALSPTTSAGGSVTYRVRLSLGPGQREDGTPAPAPRPGMSAVADLEVRRAVDALSVPASAIVRDGARDELYVVVAGRAQRRTVSLGAQGDTTVQVLEGVKEGDRVVVRGADALRDGQELPKP